jgi:hypothetical protein
MDDERPGVAIFLDFANLDWFVEALPGPVVAWLLVGMLREM